GAESFIDLDRAPAASLVILSRLASAEISDYRLDMALRWAAIHQVAAVAAFAHGAWRPTVTARDIAGRAGIALISIPTGTEIAGLVQAIVREIGGGAERALGRAEQGLAAGLAAAAAGSGGGGLRAAGAPARRAASRPGRAARTSAAASAAAAVRAAANGAPGAPPPGDWPAPLAGHRPGARDAVAGRGAEGEVSAQVVVGETPVGSFIAA